MWQIECSVQIWGDSFSPAAAESLTGLTFARTNEPGQIAERGRYAGQPLPYGSAELRLAANPVVGTADFVAPFSDALTSLRISAEQFRKVGATDITVHFDVAYEAQCNLELKPVSLALLNTLDLPVTITCFEASP